MALILTGEAMGPIAPEADPVSDIRIGFFGLLPVWTDDQEALLKSHWPLAPDWNFRGTQPYRSNTYQVLSLSSSHGWTTLSSSWKPI